ncbi:hypothetical protein JD844_032681 [Phrynosoma platyrhinos]|uniref:Biotin--protein ligase n=3 Tax=Phrynosoma TaxID=43608 RepID=A0ABQ7T626_PHRPL|nr:hypothetical protein JD844_032681 [Phrynosoma platyrhinos]
MGKRVATNPHAVGLRVKRGGAGESQSRGGNDGSAPPPGSLASRQLLGAGRWWRLGPPPRAMLITLCYLFLWARWGPCSVGLIRRTVRRLYRTRCSFTFSCCSCQSLLPQPRHLPLLKPPGSPCSLAEERVCLRAGDKVFFTGETKFLEDLNKWTLLIVSPFSYLDKIFEAEHVAFVTESISARAGSSNAATCSKEKIVKWSDYCSPLAFKGGEPYILFAEASIDNFSSLGIAFMEDRLQMDNGMVPQKIVCKYLFKQNVLNQEHNKEFNDLLLIVLAVHLQMSTLEELDTAPSIKKERNTDQMPNGEQTQDSPSKAAAKPEVEVANCAGGGDQEMQKEKSKLQNENEYPEQLEQVSEKEMGTGEHHHLHLSSCHECLELENSTIESVKFASAENIPELPDDYSGNLEDVNSDCPTEYLKRINLTGKPPNILVYVGSDPKKVKFEEIKSIITECVDFNSYTVYQLLEKQVLSVPWLDNALLLIIATSEPISDTLSKQFLTFMSKGGKILGLSATFTFGGIRVKKKNELIDTIQPFVFSNTENNEIKLNVLTSGKVFEKEIMEELNFVKPLGYLDSPDKDMMIVYLPYGNNGGEAILCQVHLEVNVQSLSSQSKDDFNLLKISNAKRYEVLTKILTQLGLNCELSEVPALTPIYLLSSNKVSLRLG